MFGKRLRHRGGEIPELGKGKVSPMLGECERHGRAEIPKLGEFEFRAGSCGEFDELQLGVRNFFERLDPGENLLLECHVCLFQIIAQAMVQLPTRDCPLRCPIAYEGVELAGDWLGVRKQGIKSRTQQPICVKEDRIDSGDSRAIINERAGGLLPPESTPHPFMDRQVSPDRSKQILRAAFRAKRPVMLWGPPGIGKSETVMELGKELGREVIDVRLALWDPTDLKGIPFYNPESKSMEWAPPCELPQAGSAAILFLDELPSAVPSVQAAAYQLIHNRRVGTYRLPEGVDIVAAGNREGDRGVTYRMPKPLANRFLHLEMKDDFDSWLGWALKRGIHRDVVGYLSYAKSDFMQFDPKSAERAFPTPRSWRFVSDFLNDPLLGEQEEVLTDLVMSAVGVGVGAKFMAHRHAVTSLPNAADILTGNLKKLPAKLNVAEIYSLVVNLCFELKLIFDSREAVFATSANFALEFMMDNFEKEYVALGSIMLCNCYGLPIENCRCFVRFIKEYGKLLLKGYKG